jgi:DNA-binding PadR family transcriptional regulator
MDASHDPPLSNSEAALLGLLAEGPMHPYQIELEVRERDMRYWTDLSMSSIYKLLRGLEKRELVAGRREVSQENRLRKVYRLTEPGRAALRETILALLAEPEHKKWGIDIAISNLAVLEPPAAGEALRAYRQELAARRREYGELEGYLREVGCPVHRLALARRPMALLAGEIEWVTNYIEELERGGDA